MKTCSETRLDELRRNVRLQRAELRRVEEEYEDVLHAILQNMVKQFTCLLEKEPSWKKLSETYSLDFVYSESEKKPFVIFNGEWGWKFRIDFRDEAVYLVLYGRYDDMFDEFQKRGHLALKLESGEPCIKPPNDKIYHDLVPLISWIVREKIFTQKMINQMFDELAQEKNASPHQSTLY